MQGSSDVESFFRGGDLDLPAVAGWLDALAPSARVKAVRSIGARAQARLFEAAKGHRAVTLDDFVPPEKGPLVEVIHEGRNSLPAFRRFQKRFCRPSRERDRLWGYNEQTWRAFTGPGYFVAEDATGGEVWIDYTQLPPEKPAAWPEILPNSARLSRVIYDGTRDLMRGVSRHVTIGRAFRSGRAMDNWFVLCREA